MISKDSFSLEHIRQLQTYSHGDPTLIERTLYAFGLLEALARTGLPFLFKGGTCLILLLDKPMRLSTDIDIVVPPGTDINEYIAKAAKIFPFSAFEEQIRKGHNRIEKRHFKFQYDSPVNRRPFYILLDVLFEENHYARVIQKPVRNALFLISDEGPDQIVSIPDANCILGDKLTAFAPHTSGIPFGIGKEMEILKQMYDIAALLDIMDDFSLVRRTYQDILQTELSYRGLTCTAGDCLKDSMDSTLCILSRGKMSRNEYAWLQDGIRRLASHVFGEKFNGEKALRKAAQVFLLTANLLSGQNTYHTIDPSKDYSRFSLGGTPFKVLNYLGRQDLETFAYVYEAAQLLL